MNTDPRVEAVAKEDFYRHMRSQGMMHGDWDLSLMADERDSWRKRARELLAAADAVDPLRQPTLVRASSRDEFDW